MSAKSEKMSAVDTAWWHMEDPTNLMMITGVMIFDGPFDYDRLRQTVAQRLLRFDRFRQRVVDTKNPLGMPTWEFDPHFSLENHLRIVGLPAPGGKRALMTFVSELMSTPLDYSKPLWQYHIVENYNGGAVLIGRLHHCIADGMALMRVLLEMTDKTPDGDLPQRMESEAEQASKPGILRRLAGPALSAAKATRDITGTIIEESFRTAQDPGRVWEAAKFGAASAAQLGKIVLRWPDPETLYAGELGVIKRSAWSEPLQLAHVKQIGRLTGGTVNDVMVTAVTGALRRYMEERGADTTDLDFRAYIPVNLRPLNEELDELGNKFGLVFLSLPVGTVDQVERLNKVKQRMEELKSSPEAFVAITLLNTAGMLPREVESAVFSFFHTKATAVLTNVPGPQEPLYLASNRLRSIMAWVPQSGKLGLGISIISYNGQILLGISTDAGLVPNPERIIELFHDEFEELMELVHQQEADEA